MTVQEFASKSKGSAILRIVDEGSQLLVFDTQYWQYITEEVLDLEITSFEIKNQLMKKAEVTVYIGEEIEDELGGDDYDDGEPEDDPADDLDDEDPADNLGGDLNDEDDGGDDGGDEP